VEGVRPTYMCTLLTCSLNNTHTHTHTNVQLTLDLVSVSVYCCCFKIATQGLSLWSPCLC